MANTFQPGDKVRRINGSWAGLYGTVISGEVYTVKDQDYAGVVLRLEELDGEFAPGAFALVQTPSQESIDAALKILQLAGEVTFKPRKPPFKSIYIMVGDYKAEVSQHQIEVGCTTITFDTAEKLWNAVLEAKKYNAQA
jgi:hypothetical protein